MNIHNFDKSLKRVFKRLGVRPPKSMTMKNGRPATQGTCPVCDTKMFRIGKS